MINDIQSLQEFILWCRDHKIKMVNIGQIKVEFSDLAYIDSVTGEILSSEGLKSNEERDTSKTMVDTLDSTAEDEDLLFWSTKS